MTVYVSDLFTATPAPVNASPTSTRTWQWLRGSSAISGATSDTYTAVTADIGSTLSATQLETNFLATTTATSAATEVVQAFDPIRLFSASEPGVWYDPTDISTLYQNASSVTPVTTPVTSFGQPVGVMLDKSKGLALGAELVTNGSFAAGTTGWQGPAGSFITITGGALVANASANNSGYYQGPSSPLTGSVYEITVVVTSITQGAITVTLGIPAPTSGNCVNITSPGTYTFRQVNYSTDNYLRVYTVGPATTASIDSVSVKSIQGNHATQSTEASRPLYGIVPVSGRRNLLTQSEAFNEAVWLAVRATKGAAQLDPNGGMTAIRVTATSANGATYQLKSGNASGTYVNSVWVRRVSGTGPVSLSTPGNVASAISITSSWQRFSVSGPSAGADIYIVVGVETSGDAIDVAFAQSELGSTPTAYQRVSTDLDVTEAGVASVGYLRFDGSTSWMVTPTITPGTDKVQVFAGVRKLSDAAFGMIVEGNTAGDGKVYLGSQASGIYQFYSRGTADAYAAGATTFPAPSSDVIAGLGDISGPFATLRVDGVTRESVSSSQGTGNYAAQPIYIGRRGGSSLPFNGHLFPLIVRFGPNLTAARIAATEAWVATKTGGVTL